MDGDGDDFRLERSRVREKMEGDRALQRVMGSKCVRKKKEKKKQRRDALQNIKDTSPMAACIKRGLRPAQKKCGKKGKKRSLRPRLRPRK